MKHFDTLVRASDAGVRMSHGLDQTRVSIEQSPRAKPLILLVDDCQDSREMYASYLHRRGFLVAEAADGRSALDQTFSLLPDLVVMDLTLPDMDGAQAIHRIRNDVRTKDLPIVVVSGHGPGRDAGSGARAWDSFLTKPCLPDVLTREIKRILS